MRYTAVLLGESTWRPDVYVRTLGLERYLLRRKHGVRDLVLALVWRVLA